MTEVDQQSVKVVEVQSESVRIKGTCNSSTWQLKADQVGRFEDSTIASSMSIQAQGDFSTASLVIEGSNDGEHWFPLDDQKGTILSSRVPFIAQPAPPTRFIRPSVWGGSEDTLITVILLMRNTR